METMEKTAKITIGSGTTWLVEEIRFRDLEELESEGTTLDSIKDSGSMTKMGRLIWMTVRRQGEKVSAADRRDGKYPVTYDDFLDEFTMTDFMDHKEVFTRFFSGSRSGSEPDKAPTGS